MLIIYFLFFLGFTNFVFAEEKNNIPVLDFGAGFDISNQRIFVEEKSTDKTSIPSILPVKEKSVTIIPYLGVNHTSYQDKGFQGAEDVKLWKDGTNYAIGVDFFKNTSVVDFGVGFDISTQRIIDTGSIIDVVLGKEKKFTINTFPIITLNFLVKKDIRLKNNNKIYFQSRAGLVFSNTMRQNLQETITAGSLIDFPGIKVPGLPGKPPINVVPPIVFPEQDTTATLENSLKIKGVYSFGLATGYVFSNNIDLGLYYNIKYFHMTGQSVLTIPITEDYFNFVVKDGGNGSAIAQELGLRIAYRF
jgi:hypothetical protein